MLRELVEYTLTPASFHARKTGYLYEAVAFESRGRRNEKYWRPHWITCRDLVTNFCDQHPTATSLALFGSGCLFEVPKALFAQRFKKIILIDQVFPRSVRAWAKLQNIEIKMLECDLALNFPKDLEADLILSANLLSQLSLAAPKSSAAAESKHLQDLHSLEKPVLLWTDTEKIFTNRNSNEVLHRMATVTEKLDQPLQNWSWNLAPAPEWDKNIDVSLAMTAIQF